MGAGKQGADIYTDASARIMALYRHRIHSADQGPKARARLTVRAKASADYGLRGCAQSGAEIFRVARRGELDEDAARRMIRAIDLLEARYTT